MTSDRTGGCLCGALRFRVAGTPSLVCYCHCRICRRSSGAPVLVWATYPAGSFGYTRGAPAVHASSDHGRRDFCAACGTQLVFRTTREPDLVDINVGSMDEPQGLKPQMHIHCESALPWLAFADGLPRHEGPAPR